MYMSAYTFQNILHSQSLVPLQSPGHACLKHRMQQLPPHSPLCSAQAAWFPDGHHTLPETYWLQSRKQDARNKTGHWFHM